MLSHCLSDFQIPGSFYLFVSPKGWLLVYLKCTGFTVLILASLFLSLSLLNFEGKKLRFLQEEVKVKPDAAVSSVWYKISLHWAALEAALNSNPWGSHDWVMALWCSVGLYLWVPYRGSQPLILGGAAWLSFVPLLPMFNQIWILWPLQGVDGNVRVGPWEENGTI